MSRLSAEVVVVGGGPAGSAVSAELARRGRDVLLLDRALFPRAKPCGECLNPGAVAALSRLALLDPVRSTGPIPLTGWQLSTASGRTAWARFPDGWFGLGVDRASFDAALLEEARRRGVRVLEGARVHRIDPGSSLRAPNGLVRGPNAESLSFEASVLVGADGLRSVVARGMDAVSRPPRLRKVSLTWRIEGRGPTRDRGRLLLGRDLTVGLAPVPGRAGEADGWNATLVVDARHVGPGFRGGAWALLARGLVSLGEPWERPAHALAGPWGSGPFDRPVRSVVAGRTILVGDAAGYYDPLTGQGIYRALRGAELAAQAIDDALPDRINGAPPSLRAPDSKVLRRYDRAVAGAFGPGRIVQRAVETVVARSALREPALAWLGRWPMGGRLLVGITGDVPKGEGSHDGR